MIRFLFFIFFCGSGYLLAQDFERVDATIELYPESFETPEAFSYLLTRDFTSEDDKVRAIYTWLIQNVTYDPEEYKKFNYSFKNFRERNAKEEKTRNKIILRTLQQGKAVCEGYAFVFEKMCQLQGIDNYLVRGDTKTHFNDIGRPFKKNHLWNAAKVSGVWQLFDATWGAGKYREKFIKEPTYKYFKIAPRQLLKSHFPSMKEDQFLKDPIDFSNFSNMPLIIDSALLSEDILSPKKGIIDSKMSMNTLYFEIVKDSPQKVAFDYGNGKQEVTFEVKDQIVHFSIPVQTGTNFLLIYFDEKPVLGYKVI